MEEQKHTVLFVDDEVNIIHSLQRLFRREGCDVITASSGSEGLELVKSNRVSLVISDNMMPGMDGVEFLSKVKEVSPDTIRFMLTGYADIKAVMSAINRGEVSRYITKPWNDDELRFAVKEALERYGLVRENKELLKLTQRQNAELVDLNHNLEAKVLEKTRKIRENFFSFVKIFADLMELYDPVIGGHNKRVAVMAKALAAEMGLDEQEVDLVEAAALLHSVGLIGVPRSILDKDEKSLSMNERAVLRHSPVLTQSLFSSIDTLRQVGILIRCHNERFDGGGYPDGLREEEIPLGSRIVAVCKLYDRMKHCEDGDPYLSNPLYCLSKESGKALDPEVVSSFIKFSGGSRKEERKSKSVHVKELKEGMVLAENLMSKGRLLVSKDTVLTLELVEKILNFNKIDHIQEGARILSTDQEEIKKDAV